MEPPPSLGLIAGNGLYPRLLAESAHRAGVARVVAAAFTGETDPKLEPLVDQIEWMRVGQLGRLVNYFSGAGVRHAIMAGQIAPKNLFDLRPDMKALLALARMKHRNAESLFGAVADELAKAGIELLPATTFMDDFLAPAGLIAGRALSRREAADVEFGFAIAKEVSRLDIGQTVVVKGGTVLAVEAFEGTNEALKRGGALARSGAVMVKVSKPNHDLRFDVPVIGPATIATAGEVKARVVAIEAGRTLVLELGELKEIARRLGVSVIARELQSSSANLHSQSSAGS
ncbi:MAG: UDP-2,3-diacylglucosamine diphosphatase LpxI [Verrucomicrobiota bacterium]|nr:UDP-2,3-diacylglucosamine diphosphatase LpxI [Verrucomicrobiota bacterium]